MASPTKQYYNKLFYEQYEKIYRNSQSLRQKMQYLEQQNSSLWNQLNCFETKINDFKDEIPNKKKKKNRRTANNIQKNYECYAPNCKKSYGNQGTLRKHLSLKHPQIVTKKSNKPK